MVKVGYEQDDTALISNTFYSFKFTLSLENAGRQQHIICMKVETFKTTLRDIEQLYSWPYIFIHPKQSPADCDHKYIRGIHLLDVITDTAMEGVSSSLSK